MVPLVVSNVASLGMIFLIKRGTTLKVSQSVSEQERRGADIIEDAPLAIRLAGEAGAPAVPDEEVAQEGPAVAGEKRHEFAFDGDRVGLAGEPQAACDTLDVGIDDEAGIDTEGVAEDDVGGFAPDPG